MSAFRAALRGATEAVRNAARVLVTAHERPDGDAIGSTLGAAGIARALGAEVVMFNVDPVPDNLRFLPGADAVVSRLPNGWTPDVTVVVDCSERHRVGDAFPAEAWGDTVVCLDHHRSHDPTLAAHFAHDVDAAATAEIVLAWADEARVAVDAEMAQAIYCGLMTDTGGFRYSNTRAETLRTAARLVEAGAEPARAANEVYEREPLERVKLTQHALDSLTLHLGGQLATLAATREMYEASGADESMTDGLVGFARSIHGVEVAAQITARSDGGFRVSLRSRGRVDVGRVAEALGGGGHPYAAGFRHAGPVDAIERALVTAFSSELSRDG